MRIKPTIRFESGDTFVSSLCNHMAERAGFNFNVTLDNHGGPLQENDDDILRQFPPTVFPAAFTDRLKILSPRTWWGMIDLESKKGILSSFDISTTTRSALGLLLPLLVLFLLRHAMIRKSQSMTTTTTISSSRLLLVALVSPWSLQCLYQLCYQLTMPVRTFRTMVNTRALTLCRATDALKMRIWHRRAYRTRRYDVYLPPSMNNFEELTLFRNNCTATDTESNANAEDQALRALLFIPGASVSHEAYSEVASLLSDKGFVVAVMSLEPFRLANPHFGANMASVKRIMEEITKDIHSRAIENCLPASCEDHQDLGKEESVDKVPVQAKTVEWTLMGHSMGAFQAMRLFRAFSEDSWWNNPQRISQATIGKSEKFISAMDIVLGKQLVLLGVAAFVESATDLSDRKDAEILILQGTNDVFVDWMRWREGELKAFFPPTTQIKHIVGGTHEGFASYHSTFQLDDGDGTKKKKSKRSIPLDRQHKRVCDETDRFLRSR